MKKGVSPKRMKKIDGIAHDLFVAYVSPYIKRSKRRAAEMLALFERKPMATSSHPVIKKIIRDGRGVDGMQAAMMTWGYLAAICRYKVVTS